jgi:urease accessory protein
VGVPLPGVEIGIALSAIGLGLAVMLECKPKLAAAMAIVAAFAIFHGYAHGSELAPGTSAIAYSLGFVMATGCLHGIGIAIGLLHARPLGRRIVRLAGASVAAAGVVFLWKALSS